MNIKITKLAAWGVTLAVSDASESEARAFLRERGANSASVDYALTAYFEQIARG